jgi:hypothetical protein
MSAWDKTNELMAAVARLMRRAAIDEDHLEPVGEALCNGEPAQRRPEAPCSTTIRGPAPMRQTAIFRPVRRTDAFDRGAHARLFLGPVGQRRGDDREGGHGSEQGGVASGGVDGRGDGCRAATTPTSRSRTERSSASVPRAATTAARRCDASTLRLLRHTAAAAWLAVGHRLIFVQRQLGHRCITTTEEHYGHLEGSFVRDAAAQTEEAIGAARAMLPAA